MFERGDDGRAIGIDGGKSGHVLHRRHQEISAGPAHTLLAGDCQHLFAIQASHPFGNDSRRTAIQHYTIGGIDPSGDLARVEIENGTAENALGTGFDQGAGGFVEGDIGHVPILDEDGKWQIVENFLNELYALKVDAPLLFAFLLFGNIGNHADAEAGRQAVHDEAQEALSLQPFGFFRSFLPVQRQPLADPFLPAERAGIGGEAFRLEQITII
ncbi:hypothetical protein D3C86_1306800 [compost metagenome]